ncbi:MAG: hypothetical protein ABI823_10280 [Bryobacteraceae bacterium]
MGWTLDRWMFTAKAETTRLEFRSLTPAGPSGWGAVIDNVAVFDVRESRDYDRNLTPPPLPERSTLFRQLL